jgi:hypothetical protein
VPLSILRCSKPLRYRSLVIRSSPLLLLPPCVTSTFRITSHSRQHTRREELTNNPNSSTPILPPLLHQHRTNHASSNGNPLLRALQSRFSSTEGGGCEVRAKIEGDTTEEGKGLMSANLLRKEDTEKLTSDEHQTVSKNRNHHRFLFGNWRVSDSRVSLRRQLILNFTIGHVGR